MSIIPANFGKTWEEGKYVGIDSMSVTYTQAADTNSSSDDVQLLTIKTQTAESPGLDTVEDQQGYYFNISIEGHWSVCEGSELAELVDDFKKRLYANIPKEFEELRREDEEN